MSFILQRVRIGHPYLFSKPFLRRAYSIEHLTQIIGCRQYSKANIRTRIAPSLQLLELGIDYQTKSKTVTPLTLSKIT